MSSHNAIGKILDPRLTFALSTAVLIISLSYIHIFDPINIVSYMRDIWHHMASINALMQSPFDAGNPHIISDEPSRTFMPWYVLLALIGRLFDLTSLQVLGVGAFITVVVLMTGIYLFALEYYKKKWAPVIVMICLFGTWGLSANYTGYYNLQTLLYSASYPFAINIGLGFIGWWLVLKQLDENKINFGLLALIVLLCAFMFATHQLQGAFAIGGMGLFALFTRHGSTSIRIRIVFAIGTGLLLTALWPYYNPLKLITATSHANWSDNGALFDPENVTIFTGLAFIGLFGIYNFEQKKIRYDLLVAIMVISAGYLIGETLGNPVSHRFHAFVVLFLQLGLAAFLLSDIPDDQRYVYSFRFIQKASYLMVFVLLAVHIMDSVKTYRQTSDYLKHQDSRISQTWHSGIVASMAQVQTHVKPSDVFMAQKEIAYPVQAYKMKVVSIPRPFPLVSKMVERQEASIAFFTADISNRQRWDIIRNYNVTHIIYRISWLDNDISNSLNSFGEKIMINNDLILLKIDFNNHKQTIIGAMLIM